MALQVWLPLDGDLKNQGLADIEIINHGATINNNGKIGSCYAFSGSSTKLVATSNSIFDSAIGSIACWVYFDSMPSSSSWYCLGQIGTQGGFANCRLGLYMEYSNKINISINGSSTGANAYVHSLETNTWYHLCATFDGTIVKLYINGSEVFSKTATTGSYKTNTSNVYIGGTSGYWFKGRLNDFRVYDHALSYKEVKELSKGLILHYRLSKPMPNLLKDGAIEISCRSKNGDYPLKAISTTLTNGTKYTVSFEAKSLNGLGTFYCSLAQGGSSKTIFATQIKPTQNYQKYNFTATQGSASVNNVLFAAYYGWNNNANVTDTIYIKNVKLEEGEQSTNFIPNESDSLYSAMGYDSNIELDCAPAGNQNDGTIVGNITAVADSPRYESSYYFNGSSYINAKDACRIKDAITVSCWVKPETTSGSPVSCIQSGGWGWQAKLTSYLGTDNNGSNAYVGTKSLSSATGVWMHIALTFDGTTVSNYLNGSLISAATCPKREIYYNTNGALFIGGECNGNMNTPISIYKGNISDVRIYCTALSAEDIKELYNTAAQVDKDGNVYTYEFKEA